MDFPALYVENDLQVDVFPRGKEEDEGILSKNVDAVS